MRRFALLFTILSLSAALPLVAQPQHQESLGDLARQVRDQKSREAKKATKVFTNDNLPGPTPGEAVTTLAGQPTPPTPEQATSKPGSPSSEGTSSKPSGSTEDKAHSRDYWQEKFKAARQDVARAREMQQLSEDELNLLQIQQAREMDPTAKTDLNTRVQDKQSQVNVNKATTEVAQKALADLEREFKESGAPEEWNKTD